MSATTVDRPKPRRKTAVSATWYVQKSGNDTGWRCEFPAEAMGGRVSFLPEATLDRACEYPNASRPVRTGIPWGLRVGGNLVDTKGAYTELARSRATLDLDEVDVVFPEHEGVAVWTRPCGRRAVLSMAMREQGILTVAETDDNYMADRWWNLHQRQVGWDDAAKDMVCRAMCSMDRNVFSTAWLRDRYHKEYKARLGKQHLPDMFVCRNSIPRDRWPERDPGDGKLRVGFMGSGSHVWDINSAYAAVHAAKNYGDAETVMVGYNPAAPDAEPDELEINGEVYQMRSEKSKRYRDKWLAVVDRHIPWVDPGDYRRTALPLDIGLAPLARADDFTMGKSDSKAIEYSISGAACVLSSAGIYSQGGWKHEVNCLMAGSWREFAEQTLRLCRDPGLRFELVSAAQTMIFEERNEDTLRDEWGAALDVG